MNKTVMFITFSVLALVCLVGFLLLSIHRPDSVSAFVTFAGVMLASVTTAAGTFAAIQSNATKTKETLAEAHQATAETLDVIKVNTNGANSELRAEVARLNAALVAANREIPAPAAVVETL